MTKTKWQFDVKHFFKGKKISHGSLAEGKTFKFSNNKSTTTSKCPAKRIQANLRMGTSSQCWSCQFKNVVEKPFNSSDIFVVLG